MLRTLLKQKLYKYTKILENFKRKQLRQSKEVKASLNKHGREK